MTSPGDFDDPVGPGVCDNYGIFNVQKVRYALFEIFCENIHKLLKLQYLKIVWKRPVLDSPRFQRLLNHPALKRIQVTEDSLRDPKTLENLWYAKFVTKVEAPDFKNCIYISHQF